MRLRPFSRAHGFTLVELMVAIAVMALLALVSWRGLDSMVRSQETIRARNEQQIVLQTVIAQWNADLEALMPLEHAQVIDWDGQVLRMTRKSSAAVDDGAVVVAWARRQTAGRDQWLRWQSPPLRTRAQWREAWNQGRNGDAILRTTSAAAKPCCCPWTSGACTTTATTPGATRSPAARTTARARPIHHPAAPTAAHSCPRFLTAYASN